MTKLGIKIYVDGKPATGVLPMPHPNGCAVGLDKRATLAALQEAIRALQTGREADAATAATEAWYRLSLSRHAANLQKGTT